MMRLQLLSQYHGIPNEELMNRVKIYLITK